MTTTQQLSNSSNFTSSKDEKPGANDDLIVVTVWSALLTYGFVTNLLTLAGIARNQQMRRSTSYWLIMSLAVCDLLMITISLSHLIPATLWHDRFVAVADFRNIFAIFLYDVFWYSGVIQLGGMAVNRYVSIVHSTHYRRIFSPERTLLIMALLYCLGLGVSIPALHPCCYTVYDHKIWLTYYLEEKTWYAHVDLALNTISLTIMIFCYASILLKVRKSHLSTRRHRLPGAVGGAPSAAVTPAETRRPPPAGCGGKKVRCYDATDDSKDGTGSSNQNNQHPAVTVHRSANQPPSRREMNLFVQFFVVSAVFLATYLTWQVLGNFQISTSPWLYFTTTSFFFINNAINPTVYLIYNSGLRREVDNMICWWFGDRCRPKNSGHQQTTPSSDKEPIQPAVIVHRESILLVSGVRTTTPLLSHKNALL